MLAETDLGAVSDRVRAAGLADEGPVEVTVGRVLQLVDPDGNRVVFAGS